MLKLFFCFLITSTIGFAQVGLNTDLPQASLDVTSTDQGILIPRVELVDSADIVTVVNPDGTALVKSTLVFNTVTRNDVIPAFYYWNGVDKWVRLLIADDNEDIWKANPTNNRVEIDKLSDGVTDRPNNNVYITDESQLIIDQVTTNNDNGGSRKIQVYNGDIANYSNIPNGAAFGFLGHKSRGDIATPLTVQPDDHVTAYYSLPHNGTGYVLSSFFMQGVDPSWDGTGSVIPGDFRFNTTTVNNTIAGEKMRITSDGKVGINTPAPTEALEIHGNNGNGWDGDVDVYSQGSNITSFHIRSSSGTRTSPRSIGLKGNANIFNMEAQGYDGANYITASAIRMGVTATGDTGSSDMPGRIEFFTTPDGSSNLSNRMIVNEKGFVGIATTTPTEILEIHGNADNNWDADFDAHSYSTNITSFHIRSASGTRIAPGSLNGKTNANIYNMEAQGYDGDQYITASAIKLGVSATSNVGNDDMPGRITFATTTDGTKLLTDRMVIDDNGNVGIGTLTGLTEKLQVNGTIKATNINFTGVPDFASDADAAANASLEVGDIYRVGNDLKIKL